MQPTKKIARTLLSSQKGGGGSTITFVDDAAWPSELFDSQLDTRRRSEKREGGYGDDDDSIKSGGGERKQVRDGTWFCAPCLLLALTVLTCLLHTVGI